MISSIILWFKTSKFGLYLAGIAGAVIAFFVWIANVKRKARNEVKLEITNQTLKAANDNRKKRDELRKKYFRAISNLPNSWDDIHKLRTESKIKLPTD